MKQGFIFLFIFMLSLSAKSQLNVSTYHTNAFAIGTNKLKPVSGELKVFANDKFEFVQTELDLFYNFKASIYHKFAVGFGLNLTPFAETDQLRAFTVPLSLEIFPIKEFKKLSFLVEVAPEFMIESDARLRHLWGIRYTFGNE
jgi:hypothetical protein